MVCVKTRGILKFDVAHVILYILFMEKNLTDQFQDVKAASQDIQALSDLQDRLDYIYRTHEGHVLLGISAGPESILMIDAVTTYNQNHKADIAIACVDIPGEAYDAQRLYVSKLQAQGFDIVQPKAADYDDKKEALVRYMQQHGYDAVLYGIGWRQPKRGDREFAECNAGDDGYNFRVYNPVLDWFDDDVRLYIQALPKEWRHEDEGTFYRNGQPATPETAQNCPLQRHSPDDDYSL